MKQKLKQKSGVLSPQRMRQYRALINTRTITNDGSIDSLKEEIAKVVIKWLKTKIGEKKGNTVNRFVDVSVVNGNPGGDPPENPSTINIITMVVNCPNYKNGNSD